MNILMIIPKVPPEFSGAGNTAIKMVLGFIEKGQTIFVVTYTKNPNLIHPSVRMLCLPLFSRNRFAKMIAVFYNSVKISTFVKRNRIHVVHQMCLDPVSCIYGLFCTFFVKKVFAETTLQGSDDVETLFNRRFAFIWKYICNRYTKIINMSPRLAKSAERAHYPSEKICVIGNDVDMKLFKPVDRFVSDKTREKYSISAEQKVIISIGSVYPRKGMYEVALACCNAKQFHSNLTLILVGPLRKWHEDYISSIVKLCGSHNLSLVLTGERDDCHDLLAASDIFVFGSKEEGFGTVLAEAMSTGLPCIVNNIPDISEWIKGDSNYVYISHNQNEMNSILLQVLNFKAMDRNNAAIENRKEISSRFSSEVIYQHYLDLFADID